MRNRLIPAAHLCTVLMSPFLAAAQNSVPTSPYQPPAHKWELGLHTGMPMSFGDIKPKPGWGAGFHIRRAIDYLFSVRGEVFTGRLRQNDDFNGVSETNIQTSSLQLLFSINNLSWSNLERRRANVYAFLGGGMNRFEVDALSVAIPDLRPVPPTIQSHVDGGLGMAFRLNERCNLGMEAKALTIFGHDADRLDGVDREENDVLGYASIRLNINLGKQGKSEPLYWVNPIHDLLQDVTELKNRPAYDPTDSDGDGVIDLLDADDHTPPGIVVDTRGLPLDSDGDGLSNYLDDEPFIHRHKQAPPSEEDVRRIVESEMEELLELGSGVLGITEWFLPTAHFDTDSYAVREADLGNLASIARVLKANSRVRLVVTGFADKTASEHHNLGLGYRRAKAIIEHLVTAHGISRSRLLLNYSGEDAALVPTIGSNLMNRRVEFSVASKDDAEMDDPTPVAKQEEKKQRN